MKLGVYETFRISERHVGRQRLVYFVLMVLVLAIVTARLWRDDHGVDTAAGALFAVVVLAVAGFTFMRAYRETKAFAAEHTLILTDDAILLREGAVEHRIPYGAIESLRIRRPYVGEPYFKVTCAGLGASTFYGYESVDRLLSVLIAHLPSDRVKGNDTHA